MKQRSVRIIAEYLLTRPRARIVRLKRIGLDDYVLAIEDRRDGRVHLLQTPQDLEVWLKSIETGECLQPSVGLCGRCGRLHTDRDVDGEVLINCIPCQAELLEVALELRSEQESLSRHAVDRLTPLRPRRTDRLRRSSPLRPGRLANADAGTPHVVPLFVALSSAACSPERGCLAPRDRRVRHAGALRRMPRLRQERSRRPTRSRTAPRNTARTTGRAGPLVARRPHAPASASSAPTFQQRSGLVGWAVGRASFFGGSPFSNACSASVNRRCALVSVS